MSQNPGLSEPDESRLHSNTVAALAAVRRGFQPIPIHAGRKNPGVPQWTQLRWSSDNLAEVENRFEEWASDGYTNLGLMLGGPSGNLVDIDLDHPKTMRLKDALLPPTPMRTGRAGRRFSHFWYLCTDGTLPDTRRHKMPDGSVSVELRSDRAQTLIPPSVHPEGEPYLWEGEPWGGEDGPVEVDGRVLAVQVALLALGTVLVEHWPSQGGRHDAYLALAGGMLRYGEDVHPYWERNAAVLISAIADATHDEDGAEVRVKEAVGSTIRKLREGGKTVGFSRLAEILGEDQLRHIRRLISEVESTAGFRSSAPPLPEVPMPEGEALIEFDAADEEKPALEKRASTWSRVDLDDYLTGRVKRAEPSILKRSDGRYLMYPGRVNMLYGSSESAKTWVALHTCLEVLGDGGRVVYLDFEDDPSETVGRMLSLGAGTDDLRTQFAYYHPEEPLSHMQRNRWGRSDASESGKTAAEIFGAEVSRINPTLIVADGMSVLYGLHGLDINDTGATDVITSWLKKLTRNGRTSVIVIDHTTKATSKGVYPIGSQHKVAMVMGSLIQVWPVKQPMDGALGELELIVVKDRPSGVRPISGPPLPHSRAQVCSVVEIDSTAPGRVEMRILPPRRGGQSADGDPETDLTASKEAAANHRRAKLEQKRREMVQAAFHLGRPLTRAEISQETGLSLPVLGGIPSQPGGLLDRMVSEDPSWIAEGPSIKAGGRPAKTWQLRSAVIREIPEEGSKEKL